MSAKADTSGSSNGYRPYTDGIFYGIEAVRDEPDGETVFRTFTEAKRALLRQLRGQVAEYQRSIRDASRLTTRDVEDATDAYSETW